MFPKPKEQQKLPCRLVAQTGGAEAEFIGQSKLYFGDILCIPCTLHLGSPACKHPGSLTVPNASFLHRRKWFTLAQPWEDKFRPRTR